MNTQNKIKIAIIEWDERWQSFLPETIQNRLRYIDDDGLEIVVLKTIEDINNVLNQWGLDILIIDKEHSSSRSVLDWIKSWDYQKPGNIIKTRVHSGGQLSEEEVNNCCLKIDAWKIVLDILARKNNEATKESVWVN